MIYELGTDTLVPGKQNEFLRLAGEVGRTIRGDHYGKLEGLWTTEFGILNQVVHLWRYADLDERSRLRGELARNEAWREEYLVRMGPLVVAQENKVLGAVLALNPPRGSGHVYELRTYRTPVGRVGELLEIFKVILPVREKYSKAVGLWRPEVGPLNEVVHLWAYDDLGDRAAVRARAFQDPVLQGYVGDALPLLAEQWAIVLSPAPHSPMQ